MAMVRRFFFFNTLISFLVLVLFHLGCFIIFTSNTDHHRSSLSSKNKKRKISPYSRSNDVPSSSSSSSPSTSQSKLFKFSHSTSSSWSYIKRIFSFKSKKVIATTHHHHDENHTQTQTQTQAVLPITSPTLDYSTGRSSIVSVATQDDTILSTPTRKRRARSISDISIDNQSFPLRNDIFPCPTCGEIFHKIQNLENHQTVKHAVSELFDGDSGKNIVKIIFMTSWNIGKEKKVPNIHRILKIHNSAKILAKFEEYREMVKSKAMMMSARRRDERCIADGNELLRFHCSTFLCNLGQNGNSSLCSQQYCSVCGIIRSGFSTKMDGISTMSSSLKAHLAIPDDLEEEFDFMNVKRAMLVCRVVAGRIGSEQVDEVIEKGESTGYDSVVGRGGSNGGTSFRSDDEELLFFNPRAVLPCFAIVYSV